MFWDTTAHIMLFSLVAMRMSGLIFLNPLLGRRNIPNNVKSGIVLVLTLLVYQTASGTVYETSSSMIYGFLLIKEFAVGYVLGYVMELFYFVITYAGAILDFQLGLSMAQAYDPQTNSQVAMSGNLYQIFYSLIFFAVDGHLVLIRTIIRSGEIIPYGEVAITSGLALAVLDMFRECVILAFRFTFPIFAVEFLVQFAVGIMMKIVPQLNIFVINIQFKIAIGFFMLLILVSPMKSWMEALLRQMLTYMGDILTLM